MMGLPGILDKVTQLELERDAAVADANKRHHDAMMLAGEVEAMRIMLDACTGQRDAALDDATALYDALNVLISVGYHGKVSIEVCQCEACATARLALLAHNGGQPQPVAHETLEQQVERRR